MRSDSSPLTGNDQATTAEVEIMAELTRAARLAKQQADMADAKALKRALKAAEAKKA